MNQILIVDDEEAICWALKKALSGAGHRVATAASAEEAFVLAEKQLPDAIILDYKLPDIDGNRVCRTIRSNPQFANTRIIIISGVADPDEIAELKAAGADDFLKKPFQIDELISRLLQLLNA